MKSSQTVVPEKKLLEAIATVLSHYISETDPYILFNGLLDALLEVTQSEYGFIGDVQYGSDGHPSIRSYATTNISWNNETKLLYEKTRQKGMIFSRLDSLYGAVLKTGQLVISNQPYTDSRACGLPVGHPPLDSFMGLPFYGGGKLLGIVGVANKKHGYKSELAASLQPFLTTCGSLIEAYQNNVRHEQVARQLHKYKKRLAELDGVTSLGQGYEFNHSSLAVLHNGQPVLLTKKEMRLLELLVNNKNMPVRHEDTLDHVWPDVIVGEASVRALMRRLRQKLPDLAVKTVSGVGYVLTI